MNFFGLRTGSETQKIVSFLKAVALLEFVVAGFVFGGPHHQVGVVAAKPFVSTLVAFILAFQLVLGTYDGWYSASYFSEEDKNPTNNLRRSIFGGTLAVISIYLLVNLMTDKFHLMTESQADVGSGIK